MAGIAPPFQVPKVHISSHFSPPRRAPGAETCINRAATVKFTLSQLLPTIGRRAGNIPASDPDTHPDLRRAGNIPASDPDTHPDLPRSRDTGFSELEWALEPERAAGRPT